MLREMLTRLNLKNLCVFKRLESFCKQFLFCKQKRNISNKKVQLFNKSEDLKGQYV